ncbi:hypothetical protein OH720_02660 [Pseudomonas sp. WJP1]|uniref:hypothetical protein n=1 Tax=Pseudomonas sp. WJP1 TaxID=2986947 RepID=UPI00234B97B0|nr:hypothetical protein [Pseudomonas sp. WJP1]WCM51940.1 hypothetical protein OH720_02660 [Pseudomonas sp. WJP1]
MADTILDSYITDGNITLFFGEHSNSFKHDILNSSLLAHLVSNPNGIASDAWFHSYKKLLGNLSWLLKSQGTQTPEIESASLLSLAKLTLSRYLSATQLDDITDCFTKIRQLPDNSEKLSSILNRIQSIEKKDKQTITTVCPLLTIVREDGMVISSVIRFNTTAPVDIAIFDEELPFNKIIGTPEINQWITYLDEDSYANIRNTVIQKLGSKIKTKLFHLDATPLSN